MTGITVQQRAVGSGIAWGIVGVGLAGCGVWLGRNIEIASPQELPVLAVVWSPLSHEGRLLGCIPPCLPEVLDSPHLGT